MTKKNSKWSSKDMKADWPLLYLGSHSDFEKLTNIALKNHLEKEKDNFVIDGNKIYRKVLIGNDKAIKLVPFVPLSSRADTVADIHEAFGHFNFPNMMKILTPRAWWPYMRTDIKEWLSTCPQCQVNKRRGNFHNDEMHPLKVPSAFERWHLDFIGELPTTVKGNRWLLVAVDYATNWPIARALPVASTEAVADFIYEEIMMKFGCPVEILTDRGANFTSNLLKSYMKRVKTNHKLTSAYHPRTNAKVERFNGVLKDMLRKYTNGAIHRWDDYVNAALWACRIRIHSTTGYSPFYLTYGREPRIPGDIAIPYVNKEVFKDPRSVADFTSRELESLGQHRAAAEFRLKAMAEQDKVRWDANIKKKSYEVGDMVILTHEGRFGLEPRFKGPFIVVQVFPDYGTVKLETVQGEPLKSLVHVDRLLAAKGDTPSEPWYDPTASRRIVREVMKDSAGAPFVDSNIEENSDVTAPVVDVDPIDPIESNAEKVADIADDQPLIISPPAEPSPVPAQTSPMPPSTVFTPVHLDPMPVHVEHTLDPVDSSPVSSAPVIVPVMPPSTSMIVSPSIATSNSAEPVPTVSPLSVPGRTPVLEGGNVDVEMNLDDLLRPFPHVPIRANKRRFKPTKPANKRSRQKITQQV